jgi:basic amino acid/polyamine antiporter, APA family
VSTPVPAPPEPLPARLGLWDAVSIIVGIVVGSAIFKVSGRIAGGVAEPGGMFGVWLAGGALSLVGALCYAELATAYPRSGGDYAWLTRAFGPLAGFLFGWAHLAGILTGSIGVLAYLFAEYAGRLWTIPEGAGPFVALLAVAALSLLNVLGVAFGKAAQNVLTTAKILGLAAIAVCGFLAAAPDTPTPAGAATGGASSGGLGLSMILVLYAFGGWNDAAFVAAEIRQPRRNIPRALLLGVGLVTLIYLAINAAYLRALGWEALQTSELPPADTLRAVFGPAGDRAMSVVVMVSALGGISGLILTGSRVHASLGRDHRVFALLGRWHPRLQTPVWSLFAQALVTAGLVLAVGTEAGRRTIDAALSRLRIAGIDWEAYGGGFETLVSATAPIFWSFFLLTGLALFRLRGMDRGAPRPFPVPLYPLVPIVFCLTCAWMLYASIAWAGRLALLALIPFTLGVPLYLVSRRPRS